MNAIDLLLAQHREVENLFGELKKASEEEKLELFHAIADVLVLHTVIEEKHFYPAALDGSSEERLRQALEEHLLVKRSLADLLSMDVLGPEFDAKVQVLEEIFQHHIKDEEESIFPAAEKTIAKAKLEEIGSAMEQMSEELEEEEALYERVQDIDELTQATPLWGQRSHPHS